MFHKASAQAIPAEHLPRPHAPDRPVPGLAHDLRLSNAGGASTLARIALLSHSSTTPLQMQRWGHGQRSSNARAWRSPSVRSRPGSSPSASREHAAALPTSSGRTWPRRWRRRCAPQGVAGDARSPVGMPLPGRCCAWRASVAVRHQRRLRRGRGGDRVRAESLAGRSDRRGQRYRGSSARMGDVVPVGPLVSCLAAATGADSLTTRGRARQICRPSRAGAAAVAATATHVPTWPKAADPGDAGRPGRR